MLAIFLSIENERERQTAEGIWDRNQTRMYAIALRILKKEEDANDAVMDAIHSMVRNIKKFIDLPDDQQGYLLSIYVKNAAYKLYNKNKRTAEYVTYFEDIDIIPEYMSVEDIVLTNEEKKIAARYLKKMSELYSHPFMLRHYYEHSINEIALLTASNEEAVKKRLQRARQKMMEMSRKEYV